MVKTVVALEGPAEEESMPNDSDNSRIATSASSKNSSFSSSFESS